MKDSKSDSAIIGHLYEKLGDSNELWQCLDGIFACVVYDEKKGTFMAARCCSLLIGIYSLRDPHYDTTGTEATWSCVHEGKMPDAS